MYPLRVSGHFKSSSAQNIEIVISKSEFITVAKRCQMWGWRWRDGLDVKITGFSPRGPVMRAGALFWFESIHVGRTLHT